MNARKSILRNRKHEPLRGPGQPRIHPEAVLERRSVGLPPAWWAALDEIARKGRVKTSAVVRAAIGIELRRLKRIEAGIRVRKG